MHMSLICCSLLTGYWNHNVILQIMSWIETETIKQESIHLTFFLNFTKKVILQYLTDPTDLWVLPIYQLVLAICNCIHINILNFLLNTYDCCCCILCSPEGILQLLCWQRIFATPQTQQPAEPTSWARMQTSNPRLVVTVKLVYF